MSHNFHTQVALVKNPYEVLYDHIFDLEPGGTGKDSLQVAAYHKLEASDSKLFKVLACNPEKAKIIVPGFINLHTHLAYTDFLAASDLFSWLKKLVHKTEFQQETTAKYQKSISEALSYGTTFLVDNCSNADTSFEALNSSAARALIGVELFCSDPQQAGARLDNATKQIIELSKKQNPKIQFCLSPHASYDCCPEIWELASKWLSENQSAQIQNFLLSHLAESSAEEEWFRNNKSDETKNAREFWQSINTLDAKIQNWQAYKSSSDYLESSGILEKCKEQKILLTHLCHASAEDLQTLVKHKNISLCSCPYSNKNLNNPVADIKKWQDFDFGLGTDSLASNQNLDLRKEANYFSHLSAQEKLKLLTSSPAKILQRDDLGTLDIGKAADFSVFEIHDENINIKEADPLALIFDEKISSNIATFVDGKLVWDNHEHD